MAKIYCFTSTGNSLYTARKIAKEIGASISPMKNVSEVCDDNLIGFVFPVFFWGMPRMVERFVSGIQISNKNAYIFAVSTSGGSVFGALGRLKKKLRLKGAKLSFGINLVSITNYLPEYKVKDSEEKRNKIDAEICTIIESIQTKKSNHIMHFTLMNKIAYSFMPGEGSDKSFTISSDCTGCAICEGICPADNIIMTAGKPTFTHKCEHCLACLHICPVCAIDWKEKTHGKDRYRREGISIDELLSLNGDSSFLL